MADNNECYLRIADWQKQLKEKGYTPHQVTIGSFESGQDWPDEITIKLIVRKDDVFFESGYPEPQS